MPWTLTGNIAGPEGSAGQNGTRGSQITVNPYNPFSLSGRMEGDLWINSDTGILLAVRYGEEGLEWYEVTTLTGTPGTMPPLAALTSSKTLTAADAAYTLYNVSGSNRLILLPEDDSTIPDGTIFHFLPMLGPINVDGGYQTTWQGPSGSLSSPQTLPTQMVTRILKRATDDWRMIDNLVSATNMQNALVRRDGFGDIGVRLATGTTAPFNADHLTRKDYVDTAVAGANTTTTTALNDRDVLIWMGL